MRSFAAIFGMMPLVATIAHGARADDGSVTHSSLVNARLGVAVDSEVYSSALILGVEYERAIEPWLTIGPFVEGSVSTSCAGGERCTILYGNERFAPYVATGGFVGVRGRATDSLAFSTKLGLGWALMNAQPHSVGETSHALDAFYWRFEGALDLHHAWLPGSFHLWFGPFLALAGFSRENHWNLGLGLRSGVSW
jgi:hypothetical protein